MAAPADTPAMPAEPVLINPPVFYGNALYKLQFPRAARTSSLNDLELAARAVGLQDEKKKSILQKKVDGPLKLLGVYDEDEVEEAFTTGKGRQTALKRLEFMSLHENAPLGGYVSMVTTTFDYMQDCKQLKRLGRMMQRPKPGVGQQENARRFARGSRHIGEADHRMRLLYAKIQNKNDNIQSAHKILDTAGQTYKLAALLMPVYKAQAGRFFNDMETRLRTDYDAFMPQALQAADQVPDLPRKYPFFSIREQFEFWPAHFENIFYEMMRGLHGVVCLTTLLDDANRLCCLRTLFVRFVVEGFHNYTNLKLQHIAMKDVDDIVLRRQWGNLVSADDFHNRATLNKESHMKAFAVFNNNPPPTGAFTLEGFGIPFFPSTIKGSKHTKGKAVEDVRAQDGEEHVNNMFA